MKDKIKEFITKNLKWIILFICLIGFLALAEDVFHKEIMNGDIIGYEIISKFCNTNSKVYYQLWRSNIFNSTNNSIVYSDKK